MLFAFSCYSMLSISCPAGIPYVSNWLTRSPLTSLLPPLKLPQYFSRNPLYHSQIFDNV